MLGLLVRFIKKGQLAHGMSVLKTEHRFRLSKLWAIFTPRSNDLQCACHCLPAGMQSSCSMWPTLNSDSLADLQIKHSW